MVQNIIDAIATTAVRIEALTHPDATILQDFPRNIQLDDYSCGAKSVYCMLQYYDKQCTAESVEEQLYQPTGALYFPRYSCTKGDV